MTLTTRMTRLFRADVHGLLDRLEEPEALLRQAVRDMEDEIARREQVAAAVKAEGARASQRGERLTKEIGDLDLQLDLCLGSGKEELARGVVRRKLEVDRLRLAFDARRADAAQAAERLGRELDECKEKLTDIRRRMELFVDDSTATASGESWDQGGTRPAPVTDDDVEIALLRERERRGGAR